MVSLRLLFVLMVGIRCAQAHSNYAIFVVGMGHSGTSAMAGLLHHAGIFIGKDLIGAGAQNEKGHFEHVQTVNVNELLLALIGAQWLYSEVEPKKITELQVDWTQDLVVRTLKHHFGEHQLFALKDPRLCLLLPLYIKAARELGYTPKIITVSRPLPEIVESLLRSSTMSYEHAKRISMHYIQHIKRNIQNTDKLIVSYEELIDDPMAVVQRLHHFIPGLVVQPEQQLSIVRFIDKNLKHCTGAPVIQKAAG